MSVLVRERKCSGESTLSSLPKYSRAHWSVVGIRPIRCGLAHRNSVSDSMYGCILGECLATCAREWILYSQEGVSQRNIRFRYVYGCAEVGQPSSYVVMGI